MKSKIVILFLFVFVAVYGQKSKTYKIEYQLNYRPDTTQIKKIKSELFTLFINDSISRFISNQKLIKDSIALKARFDKNLALELIANQDKLPKSDFKFDIYKINNSQILVYENIFFDNYFYTEEIENINNWVIKKDTTIINDFKCQKAVLSFGGRNYEAWFTEEIPIKDGPYKFSNLPGLILKIQDIKEDYIFSVINIQLFNENIILPNEYNLIRISKIKFLKASKDRLKDLQKKVKHKIILSEKSKSYLNNRYKSFNNPIEFITDN